MAKEFAFEETGGNGGTVDLYKRPILAVAPVVNCARHEFLSCAGFAQKQDCRAAPRHGVHET